MSDTLIIGIITGAVALLSVGLNIFWMGKTFDHLSTAINQTRDQLTKGNDQTRDQLTKSNDQTRELVKDLATRMDNQFDRIDRRFEAIDKRFEAIAGDLKHFFKVQIEQGAELQLLKERVEG